MQVGSTPKVGRDGLRKPGVQLVRLPFFGKVGQPMKADSFLPLGRLFACQLFDIMPQIMRTVNEQFHDCRFQDTPFPTLRCV